MTRASGHAVWVGLGVAGAAVLIAAAGAGRSVESAAQPSEAGPSWGSVQAILEARCLECHGGEHRKSELSFADGSTFTLGGARGPVIDAASPEKSRLLGVIGYADPSLAMPPSGKLPDDEIETLRAWVLAGAAWPEGDSGRLADPSAHPLETHDTTKGKDWWAYQPLNADGPPSVEDPDWSRTGIDRFIYDGVVRHGLEPAPLASAEQLLRRATIDLTGLPPTPGERAEFVRAYEVDADAAWEALIDRLLASEAYGEAWGRHWLDQVRYAETNGYERDATKTNIWRYRDWVIRALNDDLPYDRFLTEQLAGDELVAAGEADESALLATGYYRLGKWDDEPADPVQARADELADIVDTTSQVFMGMTMGCARCHDHKADPISQKDYYSFTAFFNNVQGYGADEFGQHLGGGMTRPIADKPAPGQMTRDEREEKLNAARERLLSLTGSLGGAVDGPEVVILPDARTAKTEWRYVEGEPPAGWFRQGFDDRGWMVGESGFGSAGTPGAVVGTEWTSGRITVRGRFRLGEVPAGVILSIHHDEDAEVYLNGVKVASLRGYTTNYTEIQLGRDAVNAMVVGSNTIAMSCTQTGGGQYLDAGLRTGWLDTDEARVLRAEAESARGELLASLSEADRVEAERLLAEIGRLREAPVSEAYPALVVSERGGVAPEQHLLFRGSAHAPGDVVPAAVPSALEWAGTPTLPEAKADAPTTGRRLTLANWLTGDGRFITARVAANRLWQFHFGRGICRSSGDFGKLGQAPTHPELLDYLAQRLIDHGWSMKAMHKELMMSRAYRMSSLASEAALATDPVNDWYSHADPRRLTAEQYRDSVLAVSGLASGLMYGPGVYPPMPAEVLATSSRPDEAWGVSSEADAMRRSIYVFAKRSLRPPLLENLDQPDPDIGCPVRFPTNVPTQALITVNGDFTNHAAAAFAERLMGETGSVDEAVRLGVSLALGRDADDAEVSRHVAFIEGLEAEHGLSDEDAMTVYALMLFNLNEFMWVD